MPCSCGSTELRSPRHGLREHGRSGRPPGGGLPLEVRQLRRLQLRLRRLPGHALRPGLPPVLPRLLHHGNDRLRLRHSPDRTPKLQAHRPQAAPKSGLHRHRRGQEGSQRRLCHRPPELPHLRRPGLFPRQAHQQGILGQAMEGVLHNNCYEFSFG
ncbi:unnamed protein product [Linum tenue]|uniref:Uncharacterized protein n=1 Tax=Linum tenue TaxID=586396 RepID=A0AAV0P7V6_9ROSI|nr:unnamed protein product [Linum tenue]